jgi:hypothetical protein|tara:strand:+ start:206 stop:1144 length:939 start_codon:yes stop_codon:yes gene_type:complete
MEENTVELIDYLRVIWKRKMLIIAVILVSIVVAVVVEMKPGPELPVKYRAGAVVRIGKKVELKPSNNFPSSIAYIENPGDLLETLHLKYGVDAIEDGGYHFDVKRIGEHSMLKLILEGSDIGVERVLRELIDKLIDEHRKKAIASVVAYKNFMKSLEVEAKATQKNIDRTEISIDEMRGKEGEYLIDIESSRAEIKGDKDGGDRSAFLNMLYLKTIDKERELNNSRTTLQNINRQLMMHQITIGNLEDYNTEIVGEIKSTIVKPVGIEKKSTIHKIMLAGGAGLIMSLFIAFFVEYLEESKSKSKRKGKLQG